MGAGFQFAVNGWPAVVWRQVSQVQDRNGRQLTCSGAMGRWLSPALADGTSWLSPFPGNRSFEKASPRISGRETPLLISSLFASQGGEMVSGCCGPTIGAEMILASAQQPTWTFIYYSMPLRCSLCVNSGRFFCAESRGREDGKRRKGSGERRKVGIKLVWLPAFAGMTDG